MFDTNPDNYTRAQIEVALRVCNQIVFAYATADADNGGGEEVEWENIDEVFDNAVDALGKERCAVLNLEAKKANDYDPESENNA